MYQVIIYIVFHLGFILKLPSRYFDHHFLDNKNFDSRELKNLPNFVLPVSDSWNLNLDFSVS